MCAALVRFVWADTRVVKPKAQENLHMLWISKSLDWAKAELWLDGAKRSDTECKGGCENPTSLTQQEGCPEQPGAGCQSGKCCTLGKQPPQGICPGYEAVKC